MARPSQKLVVQVDLLSLAHSEESDEIQLYHK